MATILTKTSITTDTPPPEALVPREMAYSFASEKLFIKYPSGQIKEVGGYGPIQSLTQAVSQKIEASDLVTINGQTLTGGGNIEIVGGGGSTFTLVPVTASTPEDTTLTGNLFTGDNAQTGASVTQYTVAGSSTVHAGGSTTDIAGYGSITIAANGDYTVAPASNRAGLWPVVTYQAASAGGEIRQSTLTIGVTAVNDPPTTTSNFSTSLLGQAAVFYPLQGDSDIDGDAITLTKINGTVPVVGQTVTIPNGSYTYGADGGVTIQPDPLYVGTLQVTYEVADPDGLTSPSIMTLQTGASEIPIVSVLSTLDPVLAGFFVTGMGWYGPANSAHNPTSIENGESATEATFAGNVSQGWFDGTQRDSWTFNRCLFAWIAYKKTQDPIYKARWEELTEMYYNNVIIDANGYGIFTLEKTDLYDNKYHFCTPGYLYELEGGDQRYRAKALACAKSQLMTPKVVSTISATYTMTERKRGHAILETLTAYVMTADEVWLGHCNDFVNDTYLWCSSNSEGMPVHTERQHEGADRDTLMVSTWMWCLLLEAMLQHYRVTGDNRFLAWAASTGTWQASHALTPGTGEVPGMVPWYYVTMPNAGEYVGFTNGDSTDALASHSHEMLHSLKLCRWAALQVGHSTTALDAAITQLTISNNWWWGYMNRPGTHGYTRYRVKPSRAISWLINHVSYGETYAIQVPLPAPIPAPSNTSQPTLTGTQAQGVTVSVDAGVWLPASGINAPALAWASQRSTDGQAWADIAGATGTGQTYSYTYVAADAGKYVRHRVAATNSKATIYAYAGGTVTVLPAGAPAFTGQPVNVTVPSGTQAVFSWSASGSGVSFRVETAPAGSSTWTVVQDSNSNTYVIASPLRAISGQQLRVVAYNAALPAGVTSSTAVLTVTAAVRVVEVMAGGTASGDAVSATYAGLNAALAAEYTTTPGLVAADRILRVECGPMVDTTAVTFAGRWTNAGETDAEHYVHIVPKPAGRHNGQQGTGYRLAVNSTYNYVLRCQAPYTRIESIAVQSTNATAGGSTAIYTDSHVTIKGVLATVAGSNPSSSAIRCDGLGVAAAVEDCVVIGGNNGINLAGMSGAAGNARIVGNTAVGQAGSGIYAPTYSGIPTVVRNNYASAVGADMTLGSNAAMVATNNATADGSGQITGVPYSTATFTSITPGAENLSLAVGSALIGAGTATGATATNIAAEARSNPPNIGAF